MQVYKTILVTLDCSPVDAVIIDHVATLAVQNRSRVSLLHVVHSHTLDQDRALRKAAETALAACREQLEAQGIEVEILIRRGEPDREILAAIDTGSYDLVAMATHGHNLIGDFLFGSVSRTLKHNIDVPLLLIRSRN